MHSFKMGHCSCQEPMSIGSCRAHFLARTAQALVHEVSKWPLLTNICNVVVPRKIFFFQKTVSQASESNTSCPSIKVFIRANSVQEWSIRSSFNFECRYITFMSRKKQKTISFNISTQTFRHSDLLNLQVFIGRDVCIDKVYIKKIRLMIVHASN